MRELTMPSRIIREGIITSRRVDMLDFAAEVFYRRLLNVVDDFGRYPNDPDLLRAACYPLKLDHITRAHIESWIKQCEKAQLVRVRAGLREQVLEVLNFGTPRAQRSKYPFAHEKVHTKQSHKHRK